MRRWALPILVILLVTVAHPAAADPIFPRSGAPVQEELWELFTLVGWMSIVISVVVIAALAYVILKYRGDPLVKKKGEWFTHNNRLEIGWTVATALVLVFLGVVTAQALDAIERPPEPGAAVEHTSVTVIGHQWQWEFVYPDGNSTRDEMWVESGRVVNMNVISCDVLHSLFIPEFGVKIDTRVLPGEVCDHVRRTGSMPDGVKPNRFWFEANEPGRYRLQCAEYCGTAHAFMEGEIVAFEPGTRDKPYGPPPERGRVVHVEMSGTGDRLDLAPSTVDLTAGDLTTWVVWNNGTKNHDLTLGEPYNLTTGVIPPGEKVELRFTADLAGSVPYFSSRADDRERGLNGTLSVAAGQVVHVELEEWAILDGADFEAGKTYAFKVYNNGTTGHNLHIGIFTEARADRQSRFATETFAAGEVRWLNVTMPTEPVTFDWWCDVPGHAGLGMLTEDHIEIGEGGGPDAGPAERELLLPGWGPVGAVAGLALAAWIVRRR